MDSQAVRPGRPSRGIGTALTGQPVPRHILFQHWAFLDKLGQPRHKKVPMGRFWMALGRKAT